MKKTTMILMVAGGLIIQAVAAAPTVNPSASTTKVDNGNANMNTVQARRFDELVRPKMPVDTKRIDRLGNISSRPWAQIAGRPAPAAFVDDRVFEPQFSLFSFGSQPD